MVIREGINSDLVRYCTCLQTGKRLNTMETDGDTNHLPKIQRNTCINSRAVRKRGKIIHLNSSDVLQV